MTSEASHIQVTNGRAPLLGVKRRSNDKKVQLKFLRHRDFTEQCRVNDDKMMVLGWTVPQS